MVVQPLQPIVRQGTLGNTFLQKDILTSNDEIERSSQHSQQLDEDIDETSEIISTVDTLRRKTERLLFDTSDARAKAEEDRITALAIELSTVPIESSLVMKGTTITQMKDAASVVANTNTMVNTSTSGVGGRRSRRGSGLKDDLIPSSSSTREQPKPLLFVSPEH